MEYRKTGRGGAGNYHNPQDLEKTAKLAAKAKDLEAQKEGRPIAPTEFERKSSIAHAGRGGVGNITDPKTLAQKTNQNTNVTPGLQERRPSKTGPQGRGGVGNYKDEDAEKAAERARRTNVDTRIQQEAVEMVDMTLKEPEQAHLKGKEEPI